MASDYEMFKRYLCQSIMKKKEVAKEAISGVEISDLSAEKSFIFFKRKTSHRKIWSQGKSCERWMFKTHTKWTSEK